MENPLGLGCGTRGIQNEKWMFAVETGRYVFGARGVDRVVPPNISIVIPGDVLPSAFHDQNLLDVG